MDGWTQARARRTRYRVTPRCSAMRRCDQPERLRRRARPSVDSVAHRSTRSGSRRAASTRARIDVVTCFSAVGCIATDGPSAPLPPEYRYRSSRVKFGRRGVDQGANLSRPGLTLRHPGQTPVQPCTTVCLTVTQGPRSLGITGPSLPLDTPLVHLGQAGATPEGGRPVAAYSVRPLTFWDQKSAHLRPPPFADVSHNSIQVNIGVHS